MSNPLFLSSIRKKTAEYESLTEKEMRDIALDLGFQSRSTGKIAPLLVPGFALVQVAASRVLNMRHYDVQLTGGRAMCFGHVIEMGTGEGKTLTATLPLFIHALAGQGAILATSNDYLARRDAEEMGPLYAALGLSVGVIQTDMSRDQRREAYSRDITYGTMKEFGFDFLRDHSMKRDQMESQIFGATKSGTAAQPNELPVHQKPYFILIDEADSILIDDARTPLIISSAEDDETHEQQRCLYDWCAQNTDHFEEDEHYWYDREKRKVDLTPEGTAMVRTIPKHEVLAGVGLLEMYDFMERAIQVARDYQCDREYVVRDGEIVIVDEATGRISEGRRWSKGIHQAIEAKEKVKITMDTSTQAKITVQSFVSRFPVVAGMTGTAKSAATEFKKIYKMPVSIIPPNKPSRRNILPTIYAPDEATKMNMIVEDIREVHLVGRPVLVGTRSIAKSEELSKLLRQAQVPHEVLNARLIEREAEIIADAGKPGRVTVATNMAGRGTDIKISDEIVELGGLHVVGTDMHDSARIDRQLFGRCGRQGDPGTVKLFISADDKLLDSAFGKMAADKYRKSAKTKSAQWWIKLFEKAQAKVEKQHYRSRKILMYNEKMLADAQREMGLDPILDNYD